MANLYLRSTDGNNSDNGTTWALAKATLAGIASIDAAGDTVYVSQAHAESSASGFTAALAGTVASPTRLLCADDSAEPPTATADTAEIITTGASGITLSGQAYYVYGIKFSCGTGANVTFLNLGSSFGHVATFESCQFLSVSTGAGSGVNSGAAGFVRWIDCDVQLNNTSAVISGGCRLEWCGGSILSGGVSPTKLFSFGADGCDVSSVDLSNLSSSVDIFGITSTNGHCRIRNSKLPASWTGALTNGTLTYGERHEMFNCDSGDTNYRVWIEDYVGSVKQETTILETGAPDDGTTQISWRIASNSLAKFPLLPMLSQETVVWNETTGSALTATVEIVHDSQGAGSGGRFQDDEVWLEVMYLGTSGFPLGTWITDRKATVLTTAADQTDSSTTWTTTGLSSPVKQKLEVTFTPQEKGWIVGRIALAKASKVLYATPSMTVA